MKLEVNDNLFPIAKFVADNDDDYGRTFYHPEKNALHLTVGGEFVGAYDDEDLLPGYKLNTVDRTDEVKAMAAEVGITDVTIADEYYPEYDAGWIKVIAAGSSRGVKTNRIELH